MRWLSGRQCSFQLLREHAAQAPLQSRGRLLELSHACSHLLDEFIHSLLKDQLVQRHERERRVVLLKPDLIPGGHFADERT